VSRKHRRMRERQSQRRGDSRSAPHATSGPPRFLQERAQRWAFWARKTRGVPSSEDVRAMVEAGELAEYGQDVGEAAQELAFEALESADPGAAHQLALRSLQHDPRCADARRVVAEREARSEIDRAGWLKRTLAEESERLGDVLLEEFAGRLSDAVEARPYLRTRLDLACTLWTVGRYKRARTHFRTILDDDERDFLGIKYPLAMADLYLGEHEEAEQLLHRENTDEAELLVHWSRILIRVLAGEEDAADELFARIVESHDADASSLATPPPRDFPHVPYYRDELAEYATLCLRMLHHAWHAHDTSVAWLTRHAAAESAAKERAAT